MKLSTFAIKGEERVGAVIARDKVMIDLAAVEKTAARREKRKVNDFYGSMLEFLQAGNKAMTAAKKLVKPLAEKMGDEPKADGKTTHLVTKIKLRAPVPNPAKLFCLAGNYQDHIEEGGGRLSPPDGGGPPPRDGGQGSRGRHQGAYHSRPTRGQGGPCGPTSSR